MFRTLKKEKLLETAEKLSTQVAERFPSSGLSQVAAEVVQVTREAVVRAESIRRPNRLLRLGLAVLLVLAVLGVGHYVKSHQDQILSLDKFLEFLDRTKGSAAYLAALAIFFVTLEARFKRRRALKAVHELRAMAHIIDMHQLTKAPDRVGLASGPVLIGSRSMTAEGMVRYLHYCTELLSLVSKIGQVYVQDFPDGTALAAVDQFENLVTGLSGKIWQKIMILDQIRAVACATGAEEQPALAGPIGAAHS